MPNVKPGQRAIAIKPSEAAGRLFDVKSPVSVSWFHQLEWGPIWWWCETLQPIKVTFADGVKWVEPGTLVKVPDSILRPLPDDPDAESDHLAEDVESEACA